MIDIDKIPDPPWNRFEWCGGLISVDGCDASDFGRDDVDRVVAFSHDGEWDGVGDITVIVHLKDGRFAAWSTWEDATGSGFCCDAYGGKSDIYFAPTVDAALSTFGEVARDVLRQQVEVAP